MAFLSVLVSSQLKGHKSFIENPRLGCVILLQENLRGGFYQENWLPGNNLIFQPPVLRWPTMQIVNAIQNACVYIYELP